MSLPDAFLEDSLEESQIKSNELKEVWFAIRSDGARGSGTQEDPYNGSEIFLTGPNKLQFDDILQNLPADVVIHLGPGVFKTGGGLGNGRTARRPWTPKSGQRIVGSGMFVTTLQLSLIQQDTDESWLRPDGVMFYAIGALTAPLLTSYEVSDLTLDCNTAGQPVSMGPQGQQYSRINCCGLRLFGSNLKVRRVRVINWGRRGTNIELFPLILAAQSGGTPLYAAEEMTNVIEDCLVEQPDWNTGDQATLVSAQVIRNCFIRGDRVRPPGDPKPTRKIKSLKETAGGRDMVNSHTTAGPAVGRGERVRGKRQGIG